MVKNSQEGLDTPAARLHGALDLMELAIEIMAQKLRRRMPAAPAEVINAELQRWIEQAPGCSISQEKG